MRRLALDISTSTGWSVFDDTLSQEKLAPVAFGCVALEERVKSFRGLSYPWSYLAATEAMAEMCMELVHEWKPDEVVVEETNGGGGRASRYSQKQLEFLHCQLIRKAHDAGVVVRYVNSSEWRKVLGIHVDKESKKMNAKLSKAKRKARDTGEKLDRKALGIRGKYTIKHAAIDYINNTFDMELRMKDDDIADAIALNLSTYRGAEFCTGGM